MRSALLCLLATGVSAQNVAFTISGTSPGISSETIGINLGHKAPEDPTYKAFLARLGVNSARMFSAGGMGGDATILTVAANVSGWVLGKSTAGTIVSTSAEFFAAVEALSVTAAHTPNPAAGAAPVFSLPWARIETNMAYRDNSKGVGSWIAGTVADQVSTLNALGISPLLVQQLGCSNGPDATKLFFTSTSPSDPTYWPQRWEVYKHGYAAASWAWRRSVTKLELANEPDFTGNNPPCWCSRDAYLDFYLVRALAAKTAYADLNADLAAGKATVANGLCASTGCPTAAVKLNVFNSAYANTNWATVAAATSNVACSSGAAGAFTGLNGASVVLNNQSFPLSGGVQSATWQNSQSFSFHSYGAGGPGLVANGMANLYGVAETKGAGPMQVYITEHARYTGASWDAEVDISDWPLAATRLGAQLLSVHGVAGNADAMGTSAYSIPAGAGLNSYIFKFSMTPYNDGSSTNLATALTSTSASPKMQSGTGSGVELGLQKHGIHYGDNNGGNDQPFSIGDTTWTGEAAALIIPTMVGGKALYNCTPSVTYSSGGVPCSTGGCFFPCVAVKSADGRMLDILVLNDGSNSAAPLERPATFDFAALVPSPSFVYVSEVSNISNAINYGEVTVFGTGATVAPGSTVTRTLTANSVMKISVPLHANTLTSVAAEADTTIYAGAMATSTAGGSANTLKFGTSATAVHDTTGAAVISFPTAGITSATNRVILKVTLATTALTPPEATYGGGSHIFQVLGLGYRTWTESALTWESATWLTGGTSPTVAITGVNNNFYRLGMGYNSSFVGHFSLEGKETANTEMMLDISDYAKQVAGCGSSMTLAIVRRFRRNSACGNTANPCATAALVFPADSLAGSTAASIYSKESGANGPSLQILADSTVTASALTTCSLLGLPTFTPGASPATASPPPSPPGAVADKPPPPSPPGAVADKPPPPSPPGAVADKPPPPSPPGSVVSSPPPRPPPPPTSVVAVQSTTASIKLTGSYTAATFLAVQQAQFTNVVASAVKQAASTVHFINVSDVSTVGRRRLQATSSTVQVFFSVDDTSATSTAVSTAITTLAPDSASFIAGGLTGLASSAIGVAPVTTEVTSTPAATSVPDTSAQVGAEYIVFSLALLMVIALGGSACMRAMNSQQGKKR
jgi:hypothetical protein